MTSNQFVIQFIADLLNKQVACTLMPDVSALGAAYLAGLKTQIYKNLCQLSSLNTDTKIFQPSNDNNIETYYNIWKKFISNNHI